MINIDEIGKNLEKDVYRMMDLINSKDEFTDYTGDEIKEMAEQLNNFLILASLSHFAIYNISNDMDHFNMLINKVVEMTQKAIVDMDKDFKKFTNGNYNFSTGGNNENKH